ncbi:hypothetical protein GCM10010306_050420 [Streptomyces umbrinus]|nr:hypothetical protein GCM10010306_050420 [Streptomyces umbrinus]
MSEERTSRPAAASDPCLRVLGMFVHVLVKKAVRENGGLGVAGDGGTGHSARRPVPKQNRCPGEGCLRNAPPGEALNKTGT